MNEKELILNNFNNIIGKSARNVKLGYGSFVTIDFGNDIETVIDTKKGKRTSVRGEWHLWLYMCAWRIDKDNEPLIGNEDEKEIISKELEKVEGKKLLEFNLINNAFDMKLKFSDSIDINLFSNNVKDSKQWMLFTPDDYVLVAGPNTSLTFKPADE
jgi:hypothetical protein